MVEIIDADHSTRFLMPVLIWKHIGRQQILQGLFHKLRKSDIMMKKIGLQLSCRQCDSENKSGGRCCLSLHIISTAWMICSEISRTCRREN
jgi:MoaA/NifB/PqqE/SkfB family radical SAM enzyme